MLPFADYYKAKQNICTPIGIIPAGSLGNMSQYGDVIRFEGVDSKTAESIIITAIANEVRKRPDAFEAIEYED